MSASARATVTRFCAWCEKERPTDVQTDRCTICGRLASGWATVDSPAPSATGIPRRSVSDAYRGQRATQSVIDAQAQSPDPAPPEEPEDDGVVAPPSQERYFFGSPVDRWPCPCGAITFWRPAAEPQPPLCGLCHAALG